MRFFACLAPLGGRRLFRFMIALYLWNRGPRTSGLLDRHQVADLENHPAHRLAVGQLHAVPDAAEPEALDHLRLVLVESDGAADLRDLHALRTAVGLRGSFRHVQALASAGASSSLP